MNIEKVDFDRLRGDQDINRLYSTKKGEIIPPDLYRVIACVEEMNALFEGFVVRDWPGCPDTLCGYPVKYDDRVLEGEVFGGMWSDYDADKNRPKHSGAFAYLYSNW